MAGPLSLAALMLGRWGSECSAVSGSLADEYAALYREPPMVRQPKCPGRLTLRSHERVNPEPTLKGDDKLRQPAFRVDVKHVMTLKRSDAARHP